MRISYWSSAVCSSDLGWSEESPKARSRRIERKASQPVHAECRIERKASPPVHAERRIEKKASPPVHAECRTQVRCIAAPAQILRYDRWSATRDRPLDPAPAAPPGAKAWREG